MISSEPYVFSRSYSKNEVVDQVVVGLDIPAGPVSLEVAAVFADGSKLFDAYGQKEYTVRSGKVEVADHKGIVLLEKVD